MAITISYTPTTPTPGTEVTLAAEGLAGTLALWELTSVPSLSDLEIGRLYDIAGDDTDAFTPDVAGEYGVKCYDYRESGFAPPRFAADPAGAAGKRLVATATGTVYVATTIQFPIVTVTGHGGTVEMTVLNDTIKSATIVDTSSDLSRVAVLDSTVVAALAACVGVTVANLGNSIQTMTASMVNAYQAHRVTTSGSVHATADAVNAMTRAYPADANAIEFCLDQLNELRGRLTGHMDSGSSSARWHTDDDGKNRLLIGPSADRASGYALMADIWRVYERHRVLTTFGLDFTVHTAADNTNSLPAAAPLTSLIIAYLDVIQSADTNAAAGEAEGANDAAHRYGFRVSA